jgi:Ran-binding protein 1
MTDAEIAPSGFATAATDAAPAAAAAPTTDADGTPAAGEDFSGTFAPVVELSEVETKTGEEDENAIFKIRAKLFRFDKESSEWKERGTGDVRLLQHKENKKVRLVMRREKTLKICLNHFVNATAALSENVGSDRSWVFHAVDYADGERDEAMLAIRFANAENANIFRDSYNSARDFMKALIEGSSLPELVISDAAAPASKVAEKTPVKAEETPVKAEEKPSEAEAGDEAEGKKEETTEEKEKAVEPATNEE